MSVLSFLPDIVNLGTIEIQEYPDFRTLAA